MARQPFTFSIDRDFVDVPEVRWSIRAAISAQFASKRPNRPKGFQAIEQRIHGTL